MQRRRAFFFHGALDARLAAPDSLVIGVTTKIRESTAAKTAPYHMGKGEKHLFFFCCSRAHFSAFGGTGGTRMVCLDGVSKGTR